MKSKLLFLVFGIMCCENSAKTESAEVGIKVGAEPSIGSHKFELPDMGFKDGFEICFNGQSRCLILTSIKWVKHEYKLIQVIHGQLVSERILSKTEYDQVATQLELFFKRHPDDSNQKSNRCLEVFVLTHKQGEKKPKTITGCTNWLSKPEKNVLLNL